LSDLWREDSSLTWRRLKVLIDGLPPESLTMTALRNEHEESSEAGDNQVDDAEPGEGRWSHTDVLLARLIDAVNENTWAVMQTQSEETVPKPDPIPRPGVKQTRTKPRYEAADPLLVEWLTRRQNGEDTTELDAELNLQNVTPLRPMTRRGGEHGGH
jgi:hypothetical protein